MIVQSNYHFKSDVQEKKLLKFKNNKGKDSITWEEYDFHRAMSQSYTKLKPGEHFPFVLFDTLSLPCMHLTERYKGKELIKSMKAY